MPEDAAAVLFVERARAVAPGFGATPAVREICRRLDGLLLAIELAAARVALLNAEEILARLEKRLPLLVSRSRDAPARQRTLRAAIEWSYELLPSEEQEVFRRLAVFQGSFSLEAAETVCDTDLDQLESLVEKSLVRRRGSGRLGLLDTILEYALDRLDQSAEAEDIRQRHAEFFLTTAESANLNPGALASGGQRLEIANAEQDNVRAALTWTLTSGSIELGLKLASAMDMFWTAHDPREGIRWFAALLEDRRAEGVALELRARALRGYGSGFALSGDHEAAERLWEQSLALFEQLGDEHGRAALLLRLGNLAMSTERASWSRRVRRSTSAATTDGKGPSGSRRRSGRKARSPATPVKSDAHRN